MEAVEKAVKALIRNLDSSLMKVSGPKGESLFSIVAS